MSKHIIIQNGSYECHSDLFENHTISYFMDFIFMQKMMALEISI